MGSLDRAIKKSAADLQREAIKSFKIGFVKTWNDKIIVSVDKWKSLELKTSGLEDLLGYFPDDYIESPLFYAPKDEKEREDVKIWSKQWKDYLYETKSHVFGELICRKCLLHPDEKYSHDNIRDVIMKGIDAKFPCDVVNFFECPYRKYLKGLYNLFVLKDLCEATDNALSHNSSLTWNNECTFFVDIEGKWLQRSNNLHKGDIDGWGPLVDLEFGFGLTKLPIRDIKVLFAVLTDMKLLKIVLDEYKGLDKEGYYLESRGNKKLRKHVLVKYMIISYFEKIKNKIRIEELRNSRGMNLEEEATHNQKFNEWVENDIQNKPKVLENRTKPRNGLCLNCGSFANAFCVNCKKWVCPEHLSEHDEEFHNGKFSKTTSGTMDTTKKY